MSRPSSLFFLFAALAPLGTAGCYLNDSLDPLAGLTIVGDDPTDLPLANATDAERTLFAKGDARFDGVFREVDGLGPLYIRQACASCHEAGGRGPGAVQKMAIVEADGVTPAADQSALPHGHTSRPFMAGGAVTPIAPPDVPGLKISSRIGPPVFGRGYMEAILESEIVRLEAEQSQRDDEIHGRINRVIFRSKANPDQSYHAYVEGQENLIGRFGYKARQPTLDDFTADAYQGDMGITSPMRPVEPPNPDGLTDDGKDGVDIDLEIVNLVADYVRLVEIPKRELPEGNGAALFAEARCDVCHTPSLRTSSAYPISALAGIDAPVYTDLLLHDMGDLLADGLVDESAESRWWKTAPLIGLRHLNAYMHDGRAVTLEAATLAHEGPGSQANDSVARFRALSAADRKALLDFVGAL